MRLNLLTIENIGPFKGRHSIDFSTEDLDKPIVLIGALNGSGKTTVLEAIQIALYGPFSQPAKASSKGYNRFIQSLFNRDASERHSSVKLDLSIAEDGKENSYTLVRNWDFSKPKVKEKFKISINKKEDLVNGEENWIKKIMHIFPPELAALFFFDGEKIEQMADLDQMPKIVKSALHSLFGIENLNILERDLEAIKIENLRKSLSKGEKKLVDQQKAELLVLEKEYEKGEALVETQRDKISFLEKSIEKLTETFSVEGGTLFDDYELHNTRLSECNSEEKHLEGKLVYLVETTLPIAIIRDKQLKELRSRVSKLKNNEEKNKLLEHFKLRDNKTIELLQKLKAPQEVVDTLFNELKGDYDYQVSKDEPEDLHLDVDEGYFERLETEISSIQNEVNIIIKKLESIEKEKEMLASLISSLPEKEKVSSIKVELETLKNGKIVEEHSLEKLEENLNSIKHKINVTRGSITKILESRIEEKKHMLESDRLAKFSEQYQILVKNFKEKVIRKNIQKIGDTATECFLTISRKKDLISSIKIDEIDFTVSLLNASNQNILVEHLSAGERQLLATSILWGFAKAAEGNFPTVIDTPLGRLDSKNRTNIVENYFPGASHQVILLSTDEEINEKYYPKMQNFIGREYTIKNLSEEKTSMIFEGYEFNEKVPIKELSA